VTFTFPGQGSHSYTVLRELYNSYPQTRPYFQQANSTGRELLGGDFLSLVTAASVAEHDERLKDCPDLDQIGIYLTEVLIARILIESGVKPALLVGHSFGELAALATGSVYSIETGLKIVCQRVLALQSLGNPGAMAALSCDLERARQFIAEMENTSIEISVINHPRQTVLSGKLSELEALRPFVNRKGVSLTLLKSRYPYHSTLLANAVEPFQTALKAFDFGPADIPVYLGLEGILYSPGSDLTRILSSQFVRTLHFSDVVKTIYESGHRTFIECGAGEIVTKLTGQNLAQTASSIDALPTAPPERSLREGLHRLFELGFGKNANTLAAVEAVEPTRTSLPSAQLLESMSLVVNDMSQLAASASRLVEQVSASLVAAVPVAAVPTDSPRANTFNGDREAPANPAPVEQAPAQAADVSPKNSQAGEKSSLPVTERIGVTASGSNGSNGFGAKSESHPEKQEVFAREECAATPIAVVSMGCVLPGARDPEQYWSNILNGVSGISNLADIDPTAGQDFLAASDGDQIKIIPDKTYTLLHGSIVDIPYDGALLSQAYSKTEFDSLTKGQKLLALAVAQSLSRLKAQVDWSNSKRMQCILGATADGSKEFDDALFLESLLTLLRNLDEPESLRRAFADTLEESTGYRNGDTKRLTQHKIFSSVIERLVGSGLKTYVVDTACSSSLYSTYLGMKALQNSECDVVMAGGVFAPGPANNTLFAQFKGLTHRQSRPFDANADGVVFSDGAGIVILKRLPDALADGDRIMAVIRAVGLSSDGKSPSINVPQVKGQGLAIQHAYADSAIDVNTIQYVEAHATATLVGDAVEFNALKDTMQRDPASPPVELGSVKALVGHTGWAAGMASLIKLCKAFEARIIPRQYNYVEPSQEIDLAHSQFTIPLASHPWPANVAPFPRRAAINGFGFGGTNAHLILEEFEETYHRNLCAQLNVKAKVPVELAVISVGSLFPGVDGALTADPSSETRFRRDALRLPAKKMLLPDVKEHMDASQYLAALAAEKAFAAMPEGWMRFKNSMGVVLGLTSKTERGMRANERVFIDRLRRQVKGHGGRGKLSSTDLNRILDKLVESIRARNVPSGPYTLPGLMPNVTAGRIANMFDLNGPNIVIDMGEDSLLQSFLVARQLLAHDACKMVLAGGVNASNVSDATLGEAVFLLALTTPEIARREGLPVLSTISFSESDAGQLVQQEVSELRPDLNYKGAHGAPEILKAINQSREKSLRCGFKQPGSGALAGRRLVFASSSSPSESASTQPEKFASTQAAPQASTQSGPNVSSTKAAPQGETSLAYAFVQGTPIRFYTPQLTEAKVEGEAKILKGHKILFLTDQPDHWLALESSGALDALEYKVVCPLGTRLAKSLPVDLTSEESIRSSLSRLAETEFDTLIAVKALEGHTKETLLLNNSESELVLLDLLFAVCRQSYERLQSQNIQVVTVCQGAYRNARLDPYTGLVSGFMKSLSRELQGPRCRAINTDEVNFYKTLRQVEIDLGQTGAEVEVCYKEGTRSTFTLARVESLSKDERPYLDADSVVIATGGARGVTAVLVEELLRRFGCRVIALGRSDASSLPEAVRTMDEQAFKDYEAQFYKDELARNKGKKIGELKREYLSYRAANEVCQVTKRLQAINGKYEYKSVDITSEKAIDEVVAETFRKYGRVDLVLHGAGVQVSTALTKKSLNEFRKIIATKLRGLSHLYKACKKYGQGGRIHFHILTSVFSYMGNDGQPDYGAANEAMSRIADLMNSAGSGDHWSSMAWLGWAGIGMTRDSEFAALAASRRLRGVTKEEGQHIFAEMLKGTPTTPINILLADGEIEYYKVAIQTSTPEASSPATPTVNVKQDFYVMEREISVESAPYLLNHLVDGVPTLPGALVIAIFGEAAQQLRPDLKINSFEKAFFHRFIKVYKNRKMRIRVEARIVSEDERETLVQVSILSDFVHSSGVVLQKDILQHEILIRMSATPLPVPKGLELNGVEGRRLLDPYVMDGSPVCLSGPFNAMENIIVGGAYRRADFKLADLKHSGSQHQSMVSKIVLMDSLWRFGVIHLAPDNSSPVFVPEECKVMKVYFDFSDFDASRLIETVTFTGANPRLDGDLLTIGPVTATDGQGNVLLVVEDGVCRRFGAVSNGNGNGNGNGAAH
jgi:acyl transferase domain-containing protein/NAD(P)-dependent dehydrogenase (short-subunit alcohol dehydrogenase family)